MKESATPFGRGRLGATVYRLGRCGRLVAWQAAARGSGLQGHRVGEAHSALIAPLLLRAALGRTCTPRKLISILYSAVCTPYI